MYAGREENFGNGRMVRNVFEKIVAAQANRIIRQKKITDKDFMTITTDDINKALYKR